MYTKAKSRHNSSKEKKMKILIERSNQRPARPLALMLHVSTIVYSQRRLELLGAALSRDYQKLRDS
jgi:hypothetical protein